MKLSPTQKIIKFFTSASLFEKMMEESKRYWFTCGNCSKESSVWEIGGIRYKGTEKQKAVPGVRSVKNLPCRIFIKLSSNLNHFSFNEPTHSPYCFSGK